MTVSDSSPYWVAKQMIWNALEDTTLTYGGYLDTWRKQQNPKANAGTNFKDSILPEKFDRHHLPALIIRNEGEVELPEELQGHSSSDRYFTVAIVGEIDVPDHKEADGDKKIMRFQHLVDLTIGEALRDLVIANSTYLPSGETTSPLLDIQPGNPVFPDFGENDVRPLFWWPLRIQLKLGSIWQR